MDKLIAFILHMLIAVAITMGWGGTYGFLYFIFVIVMLIS